MELISISLGQAVRLFQASSPIGGAYLPDVVAKFKERYGFLDGPTTTEEFDISKGIGFGHGKFQVNPRVLPGGLGYSEIIIDSLKIFNDGFVVATEGFVEDADTFLDDVMDWAPKEFRSRILKDPPMRYSYGSHVEVEFFGSLDLMFPLVNSLNKQMVDNLRRYGSLPPEYEFSGFSLQCDTVKAGSPTPGAFIFERRAQHPFSSNVYFSSAPLKTEDHLKLLEELEKLAVTLK